MPGDYQLVQLANGEKTLFSASYGEKMHPGLGPVAEAELLYVRQINICERLKTHDGEFVIWDVGLGAAANAVAALRATREISSTLRLVSFDNTIEPLRFALENAAELGYVVGYEEQIESLIRDGQATFNNGKLKTRWELQVGDFPALLERRSPIRLVENISIRAGAEPRRGKETGAPHAIFFDAFSPAKNPAMWTLPVFQNLFLSLDSSRLCALTTYSRSTLVRATLLLAGFYVGVGHATGMKEETTIAANDLRLIAEPLDHRWLERAARSDSAEPLREPVYSRSPMTPESMSKLRSHPQFS